MKTKTLFLREGGKCFYCRNQIKPGNASIEHIIPKSSGGNDSSSNLVLTCKTLNSILGNLDVKEKMQIILNQVDQNGGFKCPMKRKFTEHIVRK